MIRKFVVLSRFVSCKLRFGQALLCKEVRISIASWRNLCPNQTLLLASWQVWMFLWKNAPPPQNGWKVKHNRYSKSPLIHLWTWCQSQSCARVLQIISMVAARPQEDRLQEVFEEWRCQHDRINTSAEYCVRQAGGHRCQIPWVILHHTPGPQELEINEQES